MDTEQRLQKLEKEMENLKSVSTISYDIDRAFNARGFLKETNFVFGTLGLNFSGEATLIIPGATATSVLLISPISGSVTTNATLRKSTTEDNQYEIFAEGTAGDTFYYVVINFTGQYYTNA